MNKADLYLVVSDNQHGEGGIVTTLPQGTPEQASKKGHEDIKTLKVVDVEVVPNTHGFHSPNADTITITHLGGTIRIPKEDVGKTFVVTTIGNENIAKLLEELDIPALSPVAHIYNVFLEVQNARFNVDKPYLLDGRNGLHYFTVKEDLTIEQRFGILNNNAGLYLSIATMDAPLSPTILTVDFSQVKVEVLA